MIISASRRTDIPAWHSSWFMDRLREGEVLVKNPYNTERSRRVNLLPEAVDAIVFWTRNPKPLFRYLEEISQRGYLFYFLYTITPYGKDLEPHIPSLESQLEMYHELVSLIGMDRVVWRYDPIIISETFNESFHLEAIEKLAMDLRGIANRCIVSFVEPYRKCRKNLEKIGYQNVDLFARKDLLRRMALAAGTDIVLQTCSQDPLLNSGQVNQGPCIDIDRINRIGGKQLEYQADKNQRTQCRCALSVDIGEYGTCRGGCIYCYASGK